MLKLVKIFFINSLKLNYFRIGKKKAKMWGFAALMLFAAACCLFAAGQYAYAIASAGLPGMILPLFMSGASLVTLFSALFSAKSVLFGFKDYDLQASLPLRHSQLVASRFIILYVYEFLLTAGLLVPAAAVYAWFKDAGPAFYISFILALFFVPLMPLAIGSVLGVLAGAAASRFRGSGVIQIIFLMALSLGIMWLNWSSGNGVSAAAVSAVYGAVSRRWPPAAIYGAALEGSLSALAAFIALSAAVFILFVFLASRWYGKINAAVTAVYTKGSYRIRGLKARGAFKALVLKELKAYFGSVLWVFNSAFGIIILLGVAAASLFVGEDYLAKLGPVRGYIMPVLPLLVCLVVSMSNVSCCSISMEDGRLWLIKSLPVSEKTVLLSKMAVNFLLTAPACVIAAALLCVGLRPGLATGIYLFLAPLAYSLFVAPFGLAVNLLLPKLEWATEAQVVKQSASVMVAVFGGMAAAGIPMALCFASDPAIVVPSASAAAALAGVGLGLWLMRAGVKRFRALS